MLDDTPGPTEELRILARLAQVKGQLDLLKHEARRLEADLLALAPDRAARRG